MVERRAVCLNCIDGRVQIPVIEWIKDSYHVDYVDMITEPGMDGLLSNKNRSIEEIKVKTRISIEINRADMIVIVAHHDCRGNKVSESEHREEVQVAIERLKAEFKDIDVIGVWVNERWQVEKI